MYDYFHVTPRDEAFFEEHILPLMPKEVIDAHAHFNLPQHVRNISQETIAGDWALECGLLMSYGDARAYIAAMFPGIEYGFVALPWPLKDADTAANNAYISELIKDRGQFGLFTVRPEYTPEYIESRYACGGFCGFKPYPYMASAVKGADVSIFDFMPRPQFELADRLNAPVLMHLPRAGRLPDPDNIAEIRAILDDYPGVKLVIAHFGRCFNHEYFEKALDALGEDAHRLWFDCAAVMNPRVHALAFEKLDYHRIMFGTDLPIFLWHGRREWDERGYHNLCRESFTWNEHRRPEQEEGYTFFLYEQIKNMFDIIGGDAGVIQAVFHDNAAEVYGR